MEIESKLDIVMEEKEVSIETLIEKTNLPRMTIYNARQGKNVTMSTALKIAEALEVKLEDIWTSPIELEEAS